MNLQTYRACSYVRFASYWAGNQWWYQGEPLLGRGSFIHFQWTKEYGGTTMDGKAMSRETDGVPKFEGLPWTQHVTPSESDVWLPLSRVTEGTRAYLQTPPIVVSERSPFKAFAGMWCGLPRFVCISKDKLIWAVPEELIITERLAKEYHILSVSVSTEDGWKALRQEAEQQSGRIRFCGRLSLLYLHPETTLSPECQKQLNLGVFSDGTRHYYAPLQESLYGEDALAVPHDQFIQTAKAGEVRLQTITPTHIVLHRYVIRDPAALPSCFLSFNQLPIGSTLFGTRSSGRVSVPILRLTYKKAQTLTVSAQKGIYYAVFTSPRGIPIDQTQLCPTDSETTFVCHSKAIDALAIRMDKLTTEEQEHVRLYPNSKSLRILLTSRDSVDPRYRYILRTTLADVELFCAELAIKKAQYQQEFGDFKLPENWHKYDYAALKSHLYILQQIKADEVSDRVQLDAQVSLGMDSYQFRENLQQAKFTQLDPVTRRHYYPNPITMEHIRDAGLLPTFVKSLLTRLRGAQFVPILSLIREPDVHAELFQELQSAGNSLHELVDVLPPPREIQEEESPSLGNNA